MGSEEDFPEGLTFFHRAEWGAQPPQEESAKLVGPLLPLRGPVMHVFYNDTSTGMCDGLEECRARLQGLQRSHMDCGWPDITHNFLVDGSGAIYEGRGWNYQPDAMEEELRGNVIDIAFIGNYMHVHPFQPLFEAAEKLVKHGVKINKLASSYKISYFNPDY